MPFRTTGSARFCGSTAGWWKLLRPRVRDFQSAINDLERFAQLLLCDGERRVGEEIVPVHERVESLVSKERTKTLHLRARSVKRSHGLARFAIADELEDAEETDGRSDE